MDCASLSWCETIHALSKHFQVYAPDLPGYGQSAKPDVHYSLEFYVDFLEKFTTKLGITKMHVVGLSLGGAIAIRYAHLHPEQVKRMILVAPYGIFQKLPAHTISYLYAKSFFNEWSYRLFKFRFFNRWIASQSLIYDKKYITNELLEEMKQTALIPKAGKAFISFQRSELTPTGIRSNLTKELPDIQTETLFIQGTKDPLVLPVHAKKAAKLMPKAEICWLLARHWVQREQTDKFNHIVIGFLDGKIERVRKKSNPQPN